ncbi:GSCFA family protein [Bacteroides zoogleoformans]|uniref:GSCFA domain protein n=1 Tax=Bacteroides zoogleoformans TaxID=28119 RepID=A0ABN5IMP9_9BACE|nr:GSCFA domain-containing protein [Bacteroides zoogleoformans]AVM54129.1 GSCFA domain protein [Bacteroides zoogleoformans]TWJ18114.1 GSCFA family protein [Bacteroides zoogleoformans]
MEAKSKLETANFYTATDIPDNLPRLTQADRLVLLGSCFATNMGTRLQDAKFHCEVNPYGVLYNPLSISAALREMLSEKEYVEEDLFQSRGLWHSAMHHGMFSAEKAEDVLEAINRRLRSARRMLKNGLDCLLITFGTARVYEEKKTGRVVGNCHKLPEREFIRRKLSVDEIVADYTSLLSGMWMSSPGMKVVFTVSPIRHVRDGMHANRLSKATLLLAVDALQNAFPEKVCYFPAYELLLDELRDYRFYAEDMVHPSEVAVRYIWERFSRACFTAEALQIMEECENIRKSLSHKPFYPSSDEYKRFLGQIVLKIDQLNGKYPYLDFQKEREICHTRLKA